MVRLTSNAWPMSWLIPFPLQTPHADLGQGARGLSLPPGRHWGNS